ncbi:MAG: S8 family serine peptidase, partial [bacterium]
RLQDLGVVFYDFGSGPVGSRTVYPARIPYTVLSALESDPLVAAIDCAWRPGSPPPLAQSRPQIETELAWQVDDFSGEPLSGEGVIVCDVDTGILYYHPVFFRLDGATYDWLDVDGSSDLSAGDAVDLDDDGVPDGDETLRYHEADRTDVFGNDPARYDTGFDFLYVDTNNNGERDYGPPTYGENDPCYGELYFLTDDTDDDGVLDPGESLLGLGDSMVRAIRGRDGNVYRRGVNLLQSETDYWGHGTQVSGIFGGGWAGRHKMTGIAPGVECLHVVNAYQAEPPFLIPVEVGLLWARDEGADVILFEDGEWTWEFMDGSSNLEILLNEFAADDGIIPVIPAGNLATGQMHTSVTSTDGTILHAENSTVFWINFHWFASSAMTVTVTPPGGTPIIVPGEGSNVHSQGYRIYTLESVSSRGGVRHDLRIDSDPAGDPLDGDWSFDFSGETVTVHGYFVDDLSGWSSYYSDWDDPDPTHTVTWPATADSAISVAAYNPTDDGGINSFSGWGPRVDGRPCVDIAAPGSTVRSADPFIPGDFRSFGGTSSAGPHVAGAVALLKQLYPDLDSGRARELLRGGAGTDVYTTDPDRWGAGKLRIYGAIATGLSDVAETPRHPELEMSAYPNPFNPTTNIRCRLPAAEEATLRIFTVDGRQVWSRRFEVAAPGWREMAWNGVDGDGRRVASGVYFAFVRQGERYAVVRVTMVK